MTELIKPDYTAKDKNLTSLPFIKGKYKNRNNWAVKPTDDYGEACQKGSEYAAHFIQLIHDKPIYAGFNAISSMVADINFNDESSTKGYYVGFFSHIEKALYLYSKHYDNWGTYLKWKADTDKMLAKLEGKS